MSATVNILHLSDIHFSHKVAGGTYDLDADVRNEVERDLGVVFSELRAACTGIVVTGDIAYAGKTEDYRVASDWLTHVAGLTGCRPENIWVTPGNHDIDRDDVRASELLKDMHRTLRSTRGPDLDNKLRKYLEDKVAAPALFSPLRQYLAFAGRFQCEVGPVKPYWEQDLPLNDGSTLRLRGLTSVLTSDDSDDDRASRLVLGAAQTTLLRHEGVEYMTLCHHPPDWLVDQEEADTALTARARIQLFGHKHSHRIDRINDSLRIAAGAMHPEREGHNWQPRFNVVRVSVDAGGPHRSLKVEVLPRVWDPNLRQFVADRGTPGGDDRRVYMLPLGAWSPAPVAASATPQTSAPAVNPDSSRGDSMDPLRRLTYRFLSLPYHVRIEIAGRLDLLADEDKDTSDADLFRRVFRRASERGRLGALWTETERKQKDSDTGANPFIND